MGTVQTSLVGTGILTITTTTTTSTTTTTARSTNINSFKDNASIPHWSHKVLLFKNFAIISIALHAYIVSLLEK
jgi:hypothetical protein